MGDCYNAVNTKEPWTKPLSYTVSSPMVIDVLIDVKEV